MLQELELLQLVEVVDHLLIGIPRLAAVLRATVGGTGPGGRAGAGISGRSPCQDGQGRQRGRHERGATPHQNATTSHPSTTLVRVARPAKKSPGKSASASARSVSQLAGDHVISRSASGPYTRPPNGPATGATR